MNVDTGELVRIQFAPSDPGGFDLEVVPAELQAAAEKKLAGCDRAVVSLSSGGKLSKWARQERKKKRKSAQESRRRNRR